MRGPIDFVEVITVDPLRVRRFAFILREGRGDRCASERFGLNHRHKSFPRIGKKGIDGTELEVRYHNFCRVNRLVRGFLPFASDLVLHLSLLLALVNVDSEMLRHCLDPNEACCSFAPLLDCVLLVHVGYEERRQRDPIFDSGEMSTELGCGWLCIGVVAALSDRKV